MKFIDHKMGAATHFILVGSCVFLFLLMILLISDFVLSGALNIHGWSGILVVLGIYISMIVLFIGILIGAYRLVQYPDLRSRSNFILVCAGTTIFVCWVSWQILLF